EDGIRDFHVTGVRTCALRSLAAGAAGAAGVGAVAGATRRRVEEPELRPRIRLGVRIGARGTLCAHDDRLAFQARVRLEAAFVEQIGRASCRARAQALDGARV